MSSPRNLEVTSRKDIRPPLPAASAVAQVRLSPDGRRLAFLHDDGVGNGLYTCDIEPHAGAERLVALSDASIDELQWSPTGDHLAYVCGRGLPIGVERSVGWCSSCEPGEIGRVSGAAFGWGAKKPALIIADLTQSAIVHADVATGECVNIGRFEDDGNLEFPPSIAIASDGKHIAFCCRSSYRDLTEVWLLERGEEEPEPRLLTQIPGAEVSVRLFWSPKGKSVAMNILHAATDQSAIIAVHGLQGDGEVLHHHGGLDLPLTPAWSPDGRLIATFCSIDSPAPRLVLLDAQARILLPVQETVEPGTPHFIDDRTLAIDGQSSAVLLQLELDD